MSVKQPAKNRLHPLAVTSPCSQDWNSMVGNDRIRFCEHCSLHVHNLSQMTRAQALRLAADSRGRLCVRYHSTPENEIVTRTAQRGQLYQIGRRVSRLAAGAFSASLSLSTVLAEPSSPAPANVVMSEEMLRPQTSADSGSLVGTVSDQNGAMIPNAVVSLSNTRTGLAMQVASSDSGEFRFESLAAGSYTLRFQAPGFADTEMTDIYVNDSGETNVSATMQVSGISVTMGAVAIAGPGHPFVKAAQEDDIETMQALIAETDVNVRDKDTDSSALDQAVQNGNHEIVQLLISHGANVNAVDEAGRTPLMRVGEDATCDLVWNLISAGARVNHKDETGDTALMNAAYRNNSEILKTLLEAGADVNMADEDGTTPLMVAAENGRLQNVRALVLAGANFTREDSEGKNALTIAIENDQRAVIRFLRSKGALESVARVAVQE